MQNNEYRQEPKSTAAHDVQHVLQIVLNVKVTLKHAPLLQITQAIAIPKPKHPPKKKKPTLRQTPQPQEKTPRCTIKQQQKKTLIQITAMLKKQHKNLRKAGRIQTASNIANIKQQVLTKTPKKNSNYATI